MIKGDQTRIQKVFSEGVQLNFDFFTFFMLLSHLCEYACKWTYECNLAPIRNDRKTFVGVCKHSRGVAKIKNMLLKFARKAYSQHIRMQS